MLGTRHIKGVVLDFWVGAPPYFHCDRCYVFQGESSRFEGFDPQSPVAPENLMTITEISLLTEIRLGEGHIAFAPQKSMAPEELFDFLEGSVISHHEGRVTVIFPDLETHNKFFEHMNVRFPEE